MPKPPLSHYSPVLANKHWADHDGYISYYSCPYDSEIKKVPKGKKQWGRQRGLYSWDVEHALDKTLENDVQPVYKKILEGGEPDKEERILWAQFLLSQVVRTPTYMRYENDCMDALNIIDKPSHDRVGCKECGDLNFVANRDWYLIVAHKDDYFIRTDNPVLLTGFIERPETCIFYPLSPRVCFIACSMQNNWNAFSHTPKNTYGQELDKGSAHFINFHFARTADRSLIISPEHDGIIAEGMFSEVLGSYPQPPFLLHSPIAADMEASYHSINLIMERSDGIKYPPWIPFELEPYYHRM